MKAISLFSGAGGLDLGLAEAGISTLACVEIDSHCLNTLERNTDAKIFGADIRLLDPHAILNSLGVSTIDVLHGGPPCQPFSQIGKRSGTSHQDGLLIFEFLKWVKELQPSMFVIEQVKGVLRHYDVMVELFTSSNLRGYYVDYAVLNAADFGIPQVRKRVIIAGTKAESNVLKFLKHQRLYRTVGTAIETLPSVGSDAVPNHIDITLIATERGSHM